MTSDKKVELELILRLSGDAEELARRGEGAQAIGKELLRLSMSWREQGRPPNASALIERIEHRAKKERVDLEPVEATLSRLRKLASK